MKTDPKQPLLSAYPERLLTATEAIEHLDLSRNAFYDLLNAGVFPRRADGKFDSAAIRRAYFAHLEELAERNAQSGIKRLTRERARQVRTKADALEMKNRKRRGELMPFAQVRDEYAADLEGLRATFVTIPGRIGPEFAKLSPAEASARVAELIDDALTGLNAADQAVIEAAPQG